MQFIFVTSLSNKRYSYHLWLLVVTKSEKRKKSNKFNRLQIGVLFLLIISTPYIQDPKNIGPSNLYFVRINTQGVLSGFYDIIINYLTNV